MKVVLLVQATRAEKGIGAVSKLHQKFVECSLVHKFCTIFPPTHSFCSGDVFFTKMGDEQWLRGVTKTGGLPPDKLWNWQHMLAFGQLTIPIVAFLIMYCHNAECWHLWIIQSGNVLTVYAVNIVDWPSRRCLGVFEDLVAETPISLGCLLACLLVLPYTTTPLTATNTTSHCAEWAPCPPSPPLPPLCAIPEGCSGDRWGGWQPSHGL